MAGSFPLTGCSGHGTGGVGPVRYKPPPGPLPVIKAVKVSPELTNTTSTQKQQSDAHTTCHVSSHQNQFTQRTDDERRSPIPYASRVSHVECDGLRVSNMATCRMSCDLYLLCAG
jgi:hypothetical protein